MGLYSVGGIALSLGAAVVSPDILRVNSELPGEGKPCDTGEIDSSELITAAAAASSACLTYGSVVVGGHGIDLKLSWVSEAAGDIRLLLTVFVEVLMSTGR